MSISFLAENRKQLSSQNSQNEQNIFLNFNDCCKHWLFQKTFEVPFTFELQENSYNLEILLVVTFLVSSSFT